jgi:hypothetical protein
MSARVNLNLHHDGRELHSGGREDDADSLDMRSIQPHPAKPAYPAPANPADAALPQMGSIQVNSKVKDADSLGTQIPWGRRLSRESASFTFEYTWMLPI